MIIKMPTYVGIFLTKICLLNQITNQAPRLFVINSLMAEQKASLQETDSMIDGFNIGMNCGETAGQTIFHCHVHLIPRRRGDVENPRGGVRHIIAGKGFYEEKK